MNEISKAIYEREHTSVEKFDYFVCSVAGALFAYIGQTYTPHKLDSLHSVLMPLALLYLTLCFGFGFKRIQLSNIGTKLNKEVIKIETVKVGSPVFSAPLRLRVKINP